MIGSANLTQHGFAGNSEAVVFLEGQSARDKLLFSRIWTDLWDQGHAPSPEELAAYQGLYNTVKKTRQKLHKINGKFKAAESNKPKRILETDEAELDPGQSKICWIECGFITAMGRELEFKAEQGLFFGLEPFGGKARNYRFRTSEGQIISLRMKYQKNHMWRLQMNKKVPEVQRGLRPKRADGKLGRSNDVAVFTRTEQADLFEINFMKINSQAFKKLKNKSTQYGAIGRTTARSYGWC